MLGIKRKKKEKAEEAENVENPDAEKEDDGEKMLPAEPPAEDAPLTEEEQAKKKKRKMIIIGASAFVMLLVVGGGGAYFMGFGEKEHDAKKEAAAGLGEEKPIFFDMPQILVNLNTGGKQTSFVKATITLELANAADVPVVQANLPRLIDNYNTFLREMRASDLYGSAGVYRLREEMLVRANRLLAPVKVKDVLFKEILVQ